MMPKLSYQVMLLLGCIFIMVWFCIAFTVSPTSYLQPRKDITCQDKNTTMYLGADLRHASKETSHRESYGFFEYSDDQWERKKSNHMWQKQKQRGKIPLNKQKKSGRIFYQYNWEPSWSCGYEQRIGKSGDGGKWVCDAYKITQALTCNILSIGSSNNWSFEDAVFRLNPLCKIHTIDHTIVPQNKPPFVKWYNVGLGPRKHGLMATMGDILHMTGLSNTTIDILKIDCEGCEFGVYKDFFTGFFRQILIELHGVGDNFEVNKIFESMNDNGYVIFHKEPNTFGCSGDCIEYSFIKLNITKNQLVNQ